MGPVKLWNGKTTVRLKLWFQKVHTAIVHCLQTRFFLQVDLQASGKTICYKKTNTNEIVKMSSSYSKILWISLYTLNSLSYSYWKKRKIFQLTNFQSHTGCLTKHDSWWIALNVFFHILYWFIKTFCSLFCFKKSFTQIYFNLKSFLQ